MSILVDSSAVAAGTGLVTPSLTSLDLASSSAPGSILTVTTPSAVNNDAASGLLVQSEGASTQTGSFSEASDLHTLTLRSSSAKKDKTHVASASSGSNANSLRIQDTGSGLSKMSLLVGSMFVCTFLAAL